MNIHWESGACGSLQLHRCRAMERDGSPELNCSAMTNATEQDDSLVVDLSESFAEESISSRSTTSTHSGFGCRPVIVKSK